MDTITESTEVMDTIAEKEVATCNARTSGWVGLIDRFLMTALPVVAIAFILNVPQYFGLRMWEEQYLAIFMGCILISVFLTRPATSRSSPARIPWYDVVFALLSLAWSAYLLWDWPEIDLTGSLVTPIRVILGVAAFVTLMEATRRLFGVVLPILVSVFIVYALFTDWFPGPLFGKAIPWPRLAVLLYLDKNALVGITLQVAASMVLPFVLFGQLLVFSGGGKFLTDIALSIFGRFTGGPAKVPIVASAFFGTISGVAVANVYTTGKLTIPMMKRYGIEPHMAGAIEGTAGTGGVLMPPIMGVVAFMMAVFLNITYAKVCVAAAIPAIFYYLAIYIQVDRYAASRRLERLPSNEIPSLWGTFTRGYYFLVPIFILIYLLFGTALSVERAALYASASFALVSMLHRARWLNLRDVGTMLEATGRGISDVGIVCALAGLIIGVVMFTGLAFSLTSSLAVITGGSLLFLLVVTAFICILLGMGMPIVTVYILAIMLVAPGLTNLGVPDLSAHMFIFYYSLLSFITPPVMICIFAICPISGSDLWSTAWAAMRLAIVAYVIPFAFVYDPGLLFQGSWSHVLASCVSAFVGTCFLALGVEGFLFRRLSVFSRVGLICSGLLTIFSNDPALWGVAAAIALLAAGYEWTRARYLTREHPIGGGPGNEE